MDDVYSELLRKLKIAIAYYGGIKYELEEEFDRTGVARKTVASRGKDG